MSISRVLFLNVVIALSPYMVAHAADSPDIRLQPLDNQPTRAREPSSLLNQLKESRSKRTSNYDYRGYKAMCERWVMGAWNCPRQSRPTTGTVSFLVEKNGNTSQIRVTNSSQDLEFDRSLIAAVRRATPLRPYGGPDPFIEMQVSITRGGGKIESSWFDNRAESLSRYEQGMARLRAGDSKGACALFKKAIEINDKGCHELIAGRLIDTLLAIGDSRNADPNVSMLSYRLALAIDPLYSPSIQRLAGCLTALGVDTSSGERLVSLAKKAASHKYYEDALTAFVLARQKGQPGLDKDIEYMREDVLRAKGYGAILQPTFTGISSGSLFRM
ncbi:MAG: TonB family protein [Cyanobacteria bacterium]|nr:TonB family protein [Cyanobacteriota bacterium]